MFNYSFNRLTSFAISFAIVFAFSIMMLGACSGGGDGDSVDTTDTINTTETTNTAPTATLVTIVDDNGGVALVGDNLIGSYTYDDEDGDLEGTSTFSWLSNGMAISDATTLTYTLVANDSGQDITFEVTPVATTGTATGTAVTSTALLIGNYAPVATNVTLVDSNGGDSIVGDELVGSYSYSDEEGDFEGTSTFRWLRDGFAIDGATASTYTIVTADGGATITFEATPVATTGTITGLAVTSSGVVGVHYPEFITTWKTDNVGATGSDTIYISTNNTAGDYSVDWGDDVVEHNQTGDVTHTYGTAGTYTVKITGDFPRIYFEPAWDNEKLLSVENWGNIEWTTMEAAFYMCSNLRVNAKDAPNLSIVTNMHWMFYGASDFNQDISAWDTGSVTDMSGMFQNATVFNQDISTLNTSKVSNMSNMFRGALVFNQPIGDLNTSSVTDMSYMFYGASSFNQDIGSFDTSNVLDMTYIFANAQSFNQDIDNWNTIKVESMYGMFYGASAFNQPLSNWDTSSVTNMTQMFSDALVFNQNIENWNTSDVIGMSYMFYNASSFSNNDLSGWIVSPITAHVDFFTGAGTGNTEPIWP